ncbi:CerR family C-terminal domain-containing protein [Thiocapsa marina]|uniref:Transcriptional regulator TetR n=1 Tax=Thiocapsa marina 5811 TaxID=768671 RepID=F9U7A5_9GAMM|nr:CerR family C-terminal domain-containing protein [Thiocapsa marina]EGV20131.1 Transcriptional regulator TetR [Thiocapsa marina 5811]
MSDRSANPETPDTRQRLLRSALRAFGHNDYDAVSNRQLVQDAGANVAAISYHFGGKRELYLATAAYLAEQLGEGMREQLVRIEQALPDASADDCRRLLGQLLGDFALRLLVGPLSEDAPGFIFREQNQPTAAFDVLYENLFGPMHAVMAELVAGARGLAQVDTECRLVAHALTGPTIAFRAARTTLLRHLGRDAYTDDDVAQIQALLCAMTEAALDYRPPGCNAPQPSPIKPNSGADR